MKLYYGESVIDNKNWPSNSINVKKDGGLAEFIIHIIFESTMRLISAHARIASKSLHM